MFGDKFNKKFGGKPDMEEKEGFNPMGGGEMPPKDIPGSGRPPQDEEGGDDENKEKKPESDKEEGNEEETIEQVLELFDQLTPLVEKLRNRK